MRAGGTGSSPRARGTASRSLMVGIWCRFIPACAGNGVRPSCLSWWRAVHPRVRGERARARVPSRRAAGSSPRARGTEGDLAHGALFLRFIPACAGNGRGWSGRSRADPVHPRVRGERVCFSSRASSSSGSSPRARGTGELVQGERSHHRFIPACAGNGSSRSGTGSARSVHPRVRGERQGTPEVVGTFGGSSPRARGTAMRKASMTDQERFIPACAGNGEVSLFPESGKAVHPRVRGERASRFSRSMLTNGSSPRARGTE